VRRSLPTHVRRRSLATVWAVRAHRWQCWPMPVENRWDKRGGIHMRKLSSDPQENGIDVKCPPNTPIFQNSPSPHHRPARIIYSPRPCERCPALPPPLVDGDQHEDAGIVADQNLVHVFIADIPALATLEARGGPGGHRRRGQRMQRSWQLVSDEPTS